jgi:hypothetical protein
MPKKLSHREHGSDNRNDVDHECSENQAEDTVQDIGSIAPIFASSWLLKNARQCGSASFETRSWGALLRMRHVTSGSYLTLRRPEGPSRRVPI